MNQCLHYTMNTETITNQYYVGSHLSEPLWNQKVVVR